MLQKKKNNNKNPDHGIVKTRISIGTCEKTEHGICRSKIPLLHCIVFTTPTPHKFGTFVIEPLS